MAEITASAVKELREKTGAGMMDCKKALGESGGDFGKAEEYLRTKGLASAAKKAEPKATAKPAAEPKVPEKPAAEKPAADAPKAAEKPAE